jgi:hypothetical protein
MSLRISMSSMRQSGGFGNLLAALTGAGGLAGVLITTLGATPVAAPRPWAAAAAGQPAGQLPNFGNPHGNFLVPPAGRGIDTSRPSHVVGTGSPASCTSAAVVSDVAAGGIITFNCGSRPVTIVMTATAKVINTEHQVVLDGGGKVTLSGGGKREILYMNTCAGTWSTRNCVNQPYPQLTVQNITFQDGYNGTHQVNSKEPSGWYGGSSGGGAIYAEGGQFKAVNSRFINNGCYGAGPDLGGGAIRALAQYNNQPVYIVNDTFIGGRCSNGGALSSISVQWDIINSLFADNKAVGHGANPARSGTLGGGSGGAIYADGRNYNVLVAGTTMSNNVANEGGGAIFNVVDYGWGKLTLVNSRLHHNPSLTFENYLGIFNHIDSRNVLPIMINSTDN